MDDFLDIGCDLLLDDISIDDIAAPILLNNNNNNNKNKNNNNIYCPSSSASFKLPDDLLHLPIPADLDWLPTFFEDEERYLGDHNNDDSRGGGSQRVRFHETSGSKCISAQSVLETRSPLPPSNRRSVCSKPRSKRLPRRSSTADPVWTCNLPVPLAGSRRVAATTNSKGRPGCIRYSYHSANYKLRRCGRGGGSNIINININNNNNKKRRSWSSSSGGGGLGRACLHCGSKTTPQWRAGPVGPKTLCNACGVRYKSGGLLPEYRPASSPTFVQSVHSNLRKRVLELRRTRVHKEEEEEEGSQ